MAIFDICSVFCCSICRYRPLRLLITLSTSVLRLYGAYQAEWMFLQLLPFVSCAAAMRPIVSFAHVLLALSFVLRSQLNRLRLGERAFRQQLGVVFINETFLLEAAMRFELFF